MEYIIYFIVFGLFLTTGIGLFASWLERKVTARIHYRVGPPVLQPLYDLLKLMIKETLIPRGASKFAFLFMPVMGLSSVMAAATVIWVNAIFPSKAFTGDLIVAVYLLMIPSISLMFAGFVSGNPLASIGASREMKLILSYELPFILAISVAVIKSGYSVMIGGIVNGQYNNGAFALSLSGALALIVSIICIQAKLGIAPFDIAEAETEIVGGPLVEYSGAPLMMFRLMKNMLMCVLPLLLIVLFMGGIPPTLSGALYGALKFIGLIAVITVIKNTNPRVRIDQAVKFFWGPVTIIAVIAVALAIKGY